MIADAREWTMRMRFPPPIDFTRSSANTRLRKATPGKLFRRSLKFTIGGKWIITVQPFKG